MSGFVHLHTRSDYSLCKSASTVQQLAAKAISYNMPALALTDSGSLAGAPELTRLLTASGAVKPIYGVEFHIATPETNYSASSLYPAALVLLAENESGYKNLEKLLCASTWDNIQKTGQITMTDLRAYAGGLIALSGGCDGAVSRAILNEIDPMNVVKPYLEIFGNKSFFLEVWNHGLKDDLKHTKCMQELSLLTGTELVAANNTCYTEPVDMLTREILLCIDSGCTLPKEAILTPEKYFAGSPKRHFKSPDEMFTDFASLPEALSNTLKIADRCQFVLKPRPVSLPGFTVPEGSSESTHLRNMCLAGLERRVPDAGTRYYERLESELSVISSGGYVRFFYLLADLIAYLRKTKIMGTVRGSAGGSLVCYALNITDTDPILHGLIFELFINPIREATYPDIDMEVSDDTRDMAIHYLKDKYGEKNTAPILMTRIFGNARACSAVAKALETPEQQREAIKIEEIISENVIDSAGIAISDTHIPKMAGLIRGDECAACSLYTWDDLDYYFGVFRIDILGLRSLRLNAEVAALVTKECPDLLPTGGFSPEHLPLHDEKTLALLRGGSTDGVLNLESKTMKEYLRMCSPDSFSDICALSAMFRPPLLKWIVFYCAEKNNLTLTENKNCTSDELNDFRRLKDLCSGIPAIRDILAPTFYLPIYQEQIIIIIQLLFNCNTAQAVFYYREFNAKKLTVISECEKLLTNKGNTIGLDIKSSQFLFNSIQHNWSAHSISKAHTFAFTLIVWQSAFLKAHFPTQFEKKQQ